MPRRRLRRFQHLERPRPDRAAPEPSTPSAGRFEALRRPPAAGAPAPARTGANLERFGPGPEPRIELVEAEGGRLPFQRCARCGMDANVFATSCAGCGANLDTEEQRAFNERLHAERREQAAREAAAAAEREAIRARAEAEDERARRALYEEYAREVGRRERARLDREGIGADPLSIGDFGGLVRRVLRALFRTRVRSRRFF